MALTSVFGSTMAGGVSDLSAFFLAVVLRDGLDREAAALREPELRVLVPRVPELREDVPLRA
ncbi:hypothetical protein ACFQ07_07120, partial [Actinomadura adrarensis]